MRPTLDNRSRWTYHHLFYSFATAHTHYSILTYSCQPYLGNAQKWKTFNYEDIFDMKAGKYYPTESYREGNTPLVSASENNNGVIKFTDLEPIYKNCLTVGKIGMSTYYQNIPFVATSDVTTLIPKSGVLFDKYVGLFIATIMNQEKYKWYGRQIRLNDCKKLITKLPATSQGEPDWEFMENYIKSLPYSFSL